MAARFILTVRRNADRSNRYESDRYVAEVMDNSCNQPVDVRSFYCRDEAVAWGRFLVAKLEMTKGAKGRVSLFRHVD